MVNSLRAEGISYEVGSTTLLSDINITFTSGNVHVLVGPNGAGKSTLLKLLAGEIVPTAGDVLLGDKRLSDYDKRDLALRRAVMPQDIALSLAFTSEEVVMLGRYPHMNSPRRSNRTVGGGEQAAANEGEPDHRDVVRSAMQDTESERLRERIYPTLSGGEQARVTMARVLAQETSIIFLDEPTASLDPRHQHLVMHLARRHARAGGTSVAVLHDLNLAAAYGDNIVFLRDGRLQAEGSPSDVLRPNILHDVFQTQFYVTHHPKLSHPIVLSLPV